MLGNEEQKYTVRPMFATCKRKIKIFEIYSIHTYSKTFMFKFSITGIHSKDGSQVEQFELAACNSLTKFAKILDQDFESSKLLSVGGKAKNG